MIIVDTNVISEMIKPSPSVRVVAWFDQQETVQLFVTTISIAEITYGLHALPKGKRRDALEEAFNKAIREAFEYRILTFDEDAAHQYGKIMAQRKQCGRPLSVLDGQIVAIAGAHRFAIATRNVDDFSGCGINLVNPFD